MKAILRTAGPMAGLLLLLAGCTSTGGTFHLTSALGDTSTLSTSADVRMVTSTPVEFLADEGRIKPKRIVCAEPSPDVVKAVQQFFAFGGSLGVDIPTQVAAQVAVSIAKARAEAAAQLGERLATIQLLRDGLYRACEAYANGAISETAYAVLLSRYDDTMITLFMGELAAGNFGRRLATLGGTTSGAATAEGELRSPLDSVKAANDAAAKKTAAEEKDKELAKAEDDLRVKKEEAEKPGGDQAQKQKAVKDAEKKVDEKKNEALMAHKTATQAAATAVATAAGAIHRVPDEKIAQVLHQIQRKYIENINADALVVACLVVMSRRTPGAASPLADLCADRKNGILMKVLEGHHQLLSALLQRADLRHAVEHINDVKKHLKGLEGAK